MKRFPLTKYIVLAYVPSDSIRDIERKTDFYYQNIMNLISQLENDGLIKKEKVGRDVRITLTDSGKKIHDMNFRELADYIVKSCRSTYHLDRSHEIAERINAELHKRKRKYAKKNNC